jgi:hypothetical protein
VKTVSNWSTRALLAICFTFASMKRYNSYHTYVKCLYVAGKLDPALLQQIPKSTRSNWNYYNLNKVLGWNEKTDFDERLNVALQVSKNPLLFSLNKTILQLGTLVSSCWNSAKEKKRFIREQGKKIVQLAETLPVAGKKVKLLARFGISKQQYDYLKRTTHPCNASLQELCRRKHPQQLTQRTVQIIKKYCSDETTAHWPARSMYYKMMREGKAFFSLSTFYHYRKWLGLATPKKKFKKQYQALTATRPFQTLHMDVTIVRLACQTKAYV